MNKWINVQMDTRFVWNVVDQNGARLEFVEIFGFFYSTISEQIFFRKYLTFLTPINFNIWIFGFHHSFIQCQSVNLVQLPNQLLQIVQTTIKKECIYKDQGCTWMVTEADDMQEHCNECKFRPYKCVGAEWGFWKWVFFSIFHPEFESKLSIFD